MKRVAAQAAADAAVTKAESTAKAERVFAEKYLEKWDDNFRMPCLVTARRVFLMC